MASIRPYPVSLLSRAHLAVFASRPNRAALPALLGVQYMLVETRNCEKVARGIALACRPDHDEYCIVENPKPSDRYTLVAHAKAVATEDEMLTEVLTHPEGPVPVMAPPEAVAALSNGYVWASTYDPGHAELTGRHGATRPRPGSAVGAARLGRPRRRRTDHAVSGGGHFLRGACPPGHPPDRAPVPHARLQDRARRERRMGGPGRGGGAAPTPARASRARPHAHGACQIVSVGPRRGTSSAPTSGA